MASKALIGENQPPSGGFFLGNPAELKLSEQDIADGITWTRQGDRP
ncbi:MAG: hypothetical protein LC775_03155 [Acidobacteria bacterium]|nr:hypothetical protein [Acidobacteriota bacterium]